MNQIIGYLGEIKRTEETKKKNMRKMPKIAKTKSFRPRVGRR